MSANRKVGSLILLLTCHMGNVKSFSDPALPLLEDCYLRTIPHALLDVSTATCSVTLIIIITYALSFAPNSIERSEKATFDERVHLD